MGRLARLSYAEGISQRRRLQYSFAGRVRQSTQCLGNQKRGTAILSVRDLRREQIVWIGGLASRQGRTMVKIGQMG